MEELVDEGIATNIGISNFQGSLIVDLLRYARIEPSALQVEIHPYLTQEPLVDFAQRLGIAVTGYSSLGPSSYVELDMDRGAPSLLEHDVVTKISKEKSKCACYGDRGRRAQR
jgi:D-xylose reductase